MKVKLFTHTNFDGIGCAILAKIAYGENVEIEYCNYDDINEKVKDFYFGNTLEYEKILITDISINNELAQDIDKTIRNCRAILPEIILLDHHKTAEYLNQYDWATVIPMQGEDKTSGTSLLYKYLLDNEQIKIYNHEGSRNISRFSEIVRKYDSWEWKDKYNDLVPKQFNDLMYLYGRDRFIDLMFNRITNKQESFGLNSFDIDLLILNQEKIDKYIASKQKQIIEKDIIGYKAGIVFAEQYSSELGNKLSEDNPHLDFIAIINLSYAVSYRTIKDNIDLGKDVAKIYGGGGHAKSAGSEISNLIKEQIINLIFQ